MSSETVSDYSGERSSTSSRTTSTQCIDIGKCDNSPNDSLNSLVKSRATDKTNKECNETDRQSERDRNMKNRGSSNVKKRCCCCSPLALCLLGVFMVVISIVALVKPPLQFVLWDKLNMRPGFPTFEWWADPPDVLRMRVHVFNITNHKRFLEGVDSKLNVQDIGPLVYLERLLHYNIRFNDNSTMTYTAKRFPIYLPDENSIDLNSTIIVPNMALLGMASYLHSAPFIVRHAFRLLATSIKSEFFQKKTLYEFLWDYRDKLVDITKNIAPGLVPVNNIGILARVYANFEDELTVTIGPKWGYKKFFLIDKFEGNPQLPGYDPNVCPDRINGSTEGVMYPEYLTKQDVLLYWRKTVCKLMPLYFDRELIVDNISVYRYNLSEIVYTRVTNGTDCYDTVPSLPAGISDASTCYFNFPIVVSYPHFYTGDPPLDYYVTGLKPDREKHNSYAVVEPITGTPFRSVARMQSNLRIHDLSGFSQEYNKFSNHVIPLLWVEYMQEFLPGYIQHTVYFITVVLPPLSFTIFTVTLFLGCFIILKQIFHINVRSSLCLRFRNKDVNPLANNKMFSFESEKFLKVSK